MASLDFKVNIFEINVVHGLGAIVLSARSASDAPICASRGKGAVIAG